MFGEEKMKGNVQKNIDNKNRVALPDFTKAEEQDILILYKDINFLSIYLEKTFDKKFITEEAKDSLTEKKNYDKLAEKILGTVKVKSQNRIIIPKEAIEYYNFQNKVTIRGAIDHINIYAPKVKTKKRQIEKEF